MNYSSKEYAILFWKNIDRKRREKFMTWTLFARKTGFTTGNISKYRFTGILPNVYTCLRIAKALDTTVEDLLDF